MMADNGAPLEAVTAPARPPCPTLPCPALPCLPRPAALPTIVIVMIIPTFLPPPLWIRIPQQRSLRDSSFHRSLAPRRSIDRSCAPLLHFPISDPHLKQVLLLSFVQTCRIEHHTNLTEKTEFPERASSSVSDLCIDICSFFFPFFDSSPFGSPFFFAEVPMRASNLVLLLMLLLSSFLFPY